MRDARIAELERRVAELEAQVRDLLARLGTNASNSSVPPSANPPQAPKPVVKKPTGRKPGGQPGHTANRAVRLPPERVQRVIPLIPDTCERCQEPLPREPGPNDPEPTWHQVAELPKVLVQVTEYQGHARTCTCGHVTRAVIPAEVQAHRFGSRLTAALAYLAGSPHVSKRGIEEISETLFGMPVALGTVANLEQETSVALQAAHEEAAEAVRAAPTKHVDESGWKQAGQRRWLWTAATTTVAFFVIHAKRGAVGLTALLGETIQGIIHSDRWSAYRRLLVECRQLCWAHLKRDFQKCVDRGGPAQVIGEQGLTLVAALFERWHRFRGGGGDRAALQADMQPIQEAWHRLLEEGSACADKKAARFCKNLLALEPALWTFVRADGVEPTNNHAERILRSGVLWRKISFGCHSDAGCRFVERLLTVVQTLRLQERNVLDYLEQSVRAHRAGSTAPKLLLGQ